MKRVRKIAALVLAAVMVMAMGSAAFAAEQPSTPQIKIHTTSDDTEGQTDTTVYTWYRIFDADIETDPAQDGPSQRGGEVAYYVKTQDRATQIEGTGLFNVTRVGTEDKWYVELKDKESTSAETIAEKFAAMDLTKFISGTFSQTDVAGYATSGEVAPGYYYITSTAGKNVVIQTLKEVEIDEKNTFPTVTKDVDSADANAQIGDEINYTMTVHVPETANDAIVLTDSMTEGLTFKSIDSVKSGSDDVAHTLNPATAEYKLTNLTIVKRIAGNKDVSIFFADGSNYKVRIIGDDGKYVGAGEIVKMNVGGKTYSVKTDKNGYANLKLSLKVKKHTITVTYKGFTTKNKVTVKSVVKPVKKTVKVKKTAKRLKIKVKIKGKKVLKKKRVYQKLKGKTYKAKTNKRGIATFKVPKKVINKLKKGKKYRAVFTYKAKANGKTIKNTAKCFVKVR